MVAENPGLADRADREAEIRRACEAGDYDEAVKVLLETYAQELLSFLSARLRDDGHADECFSLLAEDLWLGLATFEFRSSARTWAYTLARHAAARYARGPQRRAERNLTLSRNAPLSQLVDEVRTRTRSYLRTDKKDRFRALREQLEPDDQMLLILRVDRDMAWRDVALVMTTESGGEPEGVHIDREAARLRKRFERVKADLKRLAKKEGLLR